MGWHWSVDLRVVVVGVGLFAGCSDDPGPAADTGDTSSAASTSTAADESSSTGAPEPSTDTSTGDPDTTTGDPSEVCAEAHAGTTSDDEPVTICTAFHPESPLVHLPADTETTLYGSVDLASLAFITRDGTAHPIASADGATPFTCDVVRGTCTDLPELAGLRATTGPTHRWIYTIYRAEGSLHDGVLHVSSIAPEVVVDGAAIDSLLERPYEGTVTTRVVPAVDGEPIFTQTRVPIRLEPTGERNPIVLALGGEVLPDATASQMVFEVANLDAAVMLEDGSCAPALVDLGDADPLRGAEGSTVTLERVASMHGLGEHHIVIANYPAGTLDLAGASSMGGVLGQTHPLTSPAMWMAASVDYGAAFSSEYLLHGNAFIYNLVIELGAVEGGGGGC